MIASFIITFRETLEAALIIGIILGYLAKTKQTKYNNVVYLGIVSGIVASILVALLFSGVTGELTGNAEYIFEGLTMLFGALLLTTMILWMMKQKHISKELREKIKIRLAKTQRLGLFFLVFISIFREGVETVIFLGAASFISVDNTLIGALLGIIGAILLGYFMFVGSKKINLKKFFNITSILLILFSAGLIMGSIHEFQEAKILPIIVEHVWDINPQINANGSYPFLHEEGTGGSILKGLFGYTGSPSLIELLGYFIYLLLILILWKNIERVHKII